ncbi:MAG: hypothetical protein ACREJ5_02960 [Geminicoccaceae bacterium]
MTMGTQSCWTVVLVTVLVVAGVAAHAQPANTASTTLVQRPLQGNLDVIPTTRAGGFKLVQRGGRPIFVTFNQCHNAAKESCGHGIESLDHEEDSGNCAFSCLAAPSSTND